MPRKNGPPEPPPYPAKKARGAEIILRTKRQRAIFISGLAGSLLVAVIILLATYINHS